MAWTMPKRGNGEGNANSLVAFPISYEGPDSYAKPLEGTGYALVLDDDGETGYLYITTEDLGEVYDALHLYNDDGPECPQPGEKLYIMWNEEKMRAGLFLREGYIALVDLMNARACCASGYPEPVPGGWCTSPHTWDPELAEGLEFDKIEDEVGEGN